MTGTLLKVLILLVILAIIGFGLRRIWRDWTGQFRKSDEAKLQRDRRERARPEVVTLTRDKDGVFRPGGDGDQR